MGIQVVVAPGDQKNVQKNDSKNEEKDTKTELRAYYTAAAKCRLSLLKV